VVKRNRKSGCHMKEEKKAQKRSGEQLIGKSQTIEISACFGGRIIFVKDGKSETMVRGQKKSMLWSTDPSVYVCTTNI